MAPHTALVYHRVVGKTDDRMFSAVQKYPCPWCSSTIGYGRGAASLADWTLFAAKGLAMLVRPRRAIEVLLSPGMVSHCLDCRHTVAVCGHCDHPNRAGGMEMRCDHCGKIYRPG